MKVLTPESIAALAGRVDDIVAGGDEGSIVRVEMGELADGSCRPFALVTTQEAGLEQVYRISGPAVDRAPAWASREETLEVRVGDGWQRIDEPPAVAVEEREWTIIELGAAADGGPLEVGRGVGFNAYDALRDYRHNAGIEHVTALQISEAGRATLSWTDGVATRGPLGARPVHPTIDELYDMARVEIVEQILQLTEMFGLELVGISIDLDTVTFQRVVDAGEKLVHAAAAAHVLSNDESLGTERRS